MFCVCAFLGVSYSSQLGAIRASFFSLIPLNSVLNYNQQMMVAWMLQSNPMPLFLVTITMVRLLLRNHHFPSYLMSFGTCKTTVRGPEPVTLTFNWVSSSSSTTTYTSRSSLAKMVFPPTPFLSAEAVPASTKP